MVRPGSSSLRQGGRRSQAIVPEVAGQGPASGSASASAGASVEGAPSPRLRKKRKVEPLSDGAARAVQEDKLVGLGALSGGTARPYLTFEERGVLRRLMEGGHGDAEELARWEGQLMHVDFSALEMHLLLPSILAVCGHGSSSSATDDSTSLSFSELVRDITRRLAGASDHTVSKIVRHARGRDVDGTLRERNFDIEGFLKDAAHGHLPQNPSFIKFSAPLLRRGGPDRPVAEVQRRLYRELGASYTFPGRGATGDPLRQEKLILFDSLKLWRTWPAGGSNDVLSLGWAADGDVFAAGCAALTDDDNMQYNRRKNLVIGGVSDNLLRELPDHRLPRHRPATGPNSTQNIINTMDPWLYNTVSAVKMSPQGHKMYTASFDHTVKVWDVAPPVGRGRLLATLQHDSRVDVVATSVNYPNVIATGSKVAADGVRVFNTEEEVSSSLHASYSSARAMKYPDKHIHSSCMQFGIHPSVQSLLLTGFSPEGSLVDDRLAPDGDLGLWNIETSQRVRIIGSSLNTFDCIWQPKSAKFATASVSNSQANRGTRSYVRLYGAEGGSFRVMMELECPALDINEVTWWDDERYATASCTDGVTYVWDVRMYHRVMHSLRHEEPIVQLPTGDDPAWRPREKVDTGVRYAQWGESNDRFYTGSSDGIVKSWNIKRAAEDALVRDLVSLEGGVMCGAFSPDFSKLLLGDTSGGLSLLSVGLDEDEEDDRPRDFVFQNAVEVDETEEVNPFEVGRMEARVLIDRGEMVIDHSKGTAQAIQGPHYNGPWEADDDQHRASTARRELEADHARFLDNRRRQAAASTLARDSVQVTQATKADDAMDIDAVEGEDTAVSTREQALEDFDFDRGIFLP
ncbi:MAG: hypothetical protein M1832_002556 [Thelocarpon impressellum]|nr:MAG: hypothetical protein M1832_002556 [Thelocarpon impressellum]